MIDIDFLSPRANQTILTKHIEALSRGQRGTGVVYGNKITPSDPASMVIQIAAGRIRIVGAPMDVDAGSIELDTAHATLPRIDLIYRDTVGDGQCVKGTPAAIEDPKSLSDWKSYTAPLPAADIPQGAILGAVYVGPGVAAITASDIWMFAVGVEDITTVVDDPGVDTRSATEKAIRDALEATCAPIAKGVTNGDAHDHNGGDGAQINHTTLSNVGTNSHATIDTHIASTSNPHSVTAEQAGADITTSTIHAASSKSSPDDTDELSLIDSAALYILKRLTWANLKAALRAAIKLDDLAAPDDNTDLNASTSKHGLMQKLPGGASRLTGDGSWDAPYFDAVFAFGDGVVVAEAAAQTIEIPIGSNIVGARIRSISSSGALLSGSATFTLYRHAYNESIGSAVDSFSLSSASNYTENDLSIAVSAGQWLTVVLSGVTTCKQIQLILKLEAS